MKEWFYIALLDRNMMPVEYAIRRLKREFLKNELDQLLKFSGESKRAEAFRIPEGKLRPSFNHAVEFSILPF